MVWGGVDMKANMCLNILKRWGKNHYDSYPFLPSILQCPFKGFTYTSILNNNNEPPSEIPITSYIVSINHK